MAITARTQFNRAMIDLWMVRGEVVISQETLFRCCCFFFFYYICSFSFRLVFLFCLCSLPRCSWYLDPLWVLFNPVPRQLSTWVKEMPLGQHELYFCFSLPSVAFQLFLVDNSSSNFSYLFFFHLSVRGSTQLVSPEEAFVWMTDVVTSWFFSNWKVTWTRSHLVSLVAIDCCASTMVGGRKVTVRVRETRYLFHILILLFHLLFMV